MARRAQTNTKGGGAHRPRWPRYCREYEQDPSRACIDRYMNETKVADSISADCEAGTFTTFYGDALQFLGKNPEQNEFLPYLVRDRKTGRLLEGSMASGLPYDLDQFNALSGESRRCGSCQRPARAGSVICWRRHGCAKAHDRRGAVQSGFRP